MRLRNAPPNPSLSATNSNTNSCIRLCTSLPPSASACHHLMLSRCVRQDARAPCLAAANSVETPRTPCTPRGSCHLQRPLRKLGYLAARHAWQAPAWMQLLHHSAPAACALARRVSRSFLLPPGMDGALTMRPVILKMVPVAPFVDLSCSTHDDDALIGNS